MKFLKSLSLLGIILSSHVYAVSTGDSTTSNPSIFPTIVAQPYSAVGNQYNVSFGSNATYQINSGWGGAMSASCPANTTLVGGSCDMNRGGDGRETNARTCTPSGNAIYCNEGNSGVCQAHAICSTGPQINLQGY